MQVMEKIVEQGLLYDFYGSLLTGHQQKIYEQVVYDNLSLNEVAETEGVSKQAVHDLVRRCTTIMRGETDRFLRGDPSGAGIGTSQDRGRDLHGSGDLKKPAQSYAPGIGVQGKVQDFRGSSIWHLTA